MTPAAKAQYTKNRVAKASGVAGGPSRSRESVSDSLSSSVMTSHAKTVAGKISQCHTLNQAIMIANATSPMHPAVPTVVSQFE
jgi:hypothetical protein